MRRSQVTTVSLLAALALTSCTNAKDVLDPSAVKPPANSALPATQGTSATTSPTTTSPAPTATAAASTPATPAQTAAIAKTRLQVAPIVGASVEAAAPLTAELQARARQRGVTLVGSSDQTATHVLKGYFSTMSEGKDTTVIYVWDVYDPSGNRLHRINGQQKAPSAGSTEGWPAVAPATMQSIADQTIDQFTAWLGSGGAG
ncbi:cytoskeletal protein RodZ [Mesorhizobium shonense]|uniref:Cytoskeletal protein RodZ n=1 Tax=Mesorhizobium shonense TaxID=1209948 RepID=A0ABV2HNW7_9HYPH